MPPAPRGPRISYAPRREPGATRMMLSPIIYNQGFMFVRWTHAARSPLFVFAVPAFLAALSTRPALGAGADAFVLWEAWPHTVEVSPIALTSWFKSASAWNSGLMHWGSAPRAGLLWKRRSAEASSLFYFQQRLEQHGRTASAKSRMRIDDRQDQCGNRTRRARLLCMVPRIKGVPISGRHGRGDSGQYQIG